MSVAYRGAMGLKLGVDRLRVLPLLVVALVAASCGGDDPPAPLVADRGSGRSSYVPTGRVTTFGGPVLENRSERPVVLEDVRVGDEVTDVELAGVRAVTGSGGGVSHQDRWPPRLPAGTRSVPVRGLQVGRRPVTLLLGLRLAREGRFSLEELEVTYRDGDERRRLRVRVGLGVCANPAPDRPPC